jgi:hypothetical protein
MKPGDIIERKSGIEPNPLDRILLVIEGEPDVKGGILAKNGRGVVRCIDPHLYRVNTTLEERVAKKMMDSDPPEWGDDTVKTGFGDAIRRYVERERIEEMEEM